MNTDIRKTASWQHAISQHATDPARFLLLPSLILICISFLQVKMSQEKTWIGTLHCSLDETTLKNKILGQTYLLFLHHTLHTNNYQQYQQQLINWNSTTTTPALSNMETSQQWLTEVSYNQNPQDRTPTFQSNCRYLSFQRQYGKNTC